MVRLLILMLLFALPLQAERYVLDTAASRIDFSYTENGAPVRGRFPQFDGSAEFVADAPGDSAVFVLVRTSAVQLPDFVRTAFARTPDWFATEAHPRAQFELTSLSPLGGSRWQASGLMTVKGRSRPVSMPVSLVEEGRCLRARGTLTVALADFAIGRGTVSRMIRVGETVEIGFDLLGRPESGGGC
ncbi:YceI family protein [Roseobacter sp. HKCCA0434]|uniref:YceI family protein n=1 Tax=Roseobacter sp. HKCCA0434 TaxID=3079297 RepID=UPI002905C6C0|nr:YceI family protein [Roseobacter sp. HKCCA0434]